MGGLRRAGGAAAHPVDDQVLHAARLRRAPVRGGGDEPRPPDGLHGPRVVRPRGVLRPRRVLDGGAARARHPLALAVSRASPWSSSALYALVVGYFATSRRGHLLRPPHADLRRGGLHRLPLHADLRRLRRHPGPARRPRSCPASPSTRRSGSTTLVVAVPPARVPRLPRAGALALRSGARRHPRERGPRAVPRLRRAALQDGRLPDLGGPDRPRRRPLPGARGLCHARPHALEHLGRVHHHGDDRRARHAGRAHHRRRVLHRAPGEGVVVRAVVLDRDRARARPDRAVRAARAPGLPPSALRAAASPARRHG